ncbi:glycosyltransferase family 39 protein [Kitasatospora cineracea]|uniref:Mannosyltransferase n=1 Tax=Kitasatospora cineracea TaxID=88074 RepID=A0A8G1UN54_9ACTN|nr:glycosyltransferase family 39 protein [Kitasatospora cineracea]ROR44672.1 mannosyltransferase [Kitasatospora cineracea]
MFRRLRLSPDVPTAAGAPSLPRVRPAALLWAPPGLWFWPALLACVLGGYHAGRPELWRDEIATWSAATRSPGELLDMLHNVDAVSGAYYFTMHYWIALFGDSPVSLRAPSVLAVTGAAALVALSTKKLFGGPAGLSAGLLFAMVPAVSRYAQEARSYALVVLAVTAATWFLLRALEESGRVWPWWCGYAVCVLLAGAFHLVAVAILAGHAGTVAVRLRRRTWKRALPGYCLAATAAAAGLLPIVLAGQRQASRQISWIPTPKPIDLLHSLPSVFGTEDIERVLLAAAVVACLHRATRAASLQVVLLAVLPLLAVWFLSQGSSSYWTERYLLFTVPAWTMLAGAGIAALAGSAVRMRAGKRVPDGKGEPDGSGVRASGGVRLAGTLLRRALCPALLIAVGVIVLPSQSSLRAVTAHDPRDLKGTAELLAADYRPGDAIVPSRGGASYLMLDLGMRYYLPHSDRLRDVFVQTDAVRLNDFFALECPVPVDCLGSDPRVWVVAVGESPDPYADLSPAQAEALKSRYTPVRTSHAGGLTLTLLARGQ